MFSTAPAYHQVTNTNEQKILKQIICSAPHSPPITSHHKNNLLNNHQQSTLMACEYREAHRIHMQIYPLLLMDERFARQYRYEPPSEFPQTSPFSGIVHHLSGPNRYAHAQTSPN